MLFDAHYSERAVPPPIIFVGNFPLDIVQVNHGQRATTLQFQSHSSLIQFGDGTCSHLRLCHPLHLHLKGFSCLPAAYCYLIFLLCRNCYKKTLQEWVEQIHLYSINNLSHTDSLSSGQTVPAIPPG